MNSINKKLLPHLVAILTFLTVSCIYFYPQLRGEITEQPDTVSGIAMTGEIQEFSELTGETYYWNNGMFSGMPWGVLNYGAHLNINRYITKVFQLFMDRPIGYFLIGMLSCYLIFVLLGVHPWLSVAGSIAFAFNTNFLVLWEAGHNTKVLVLLHFPLVVGGLLLTLRKQWLLGGALFALGLSLAIQYTHIQMVYYMALLLTLFYGVYSVLTMKSSGLPDLLKTSATLLVAALLAAASNAGQLYSSQTFSKDTMRGDPILQATSNTKEATSSSQVKGLEWNYAMSWSNSAADLWSLLIPRAVGGSSAEEVGADTEAGRLLRQNGSPSGSDGNYKAPMYWGSLPFTSGPYYLGAIVLMVFMLALQEFNRPLRWAVISSVVFCLFLSLGKHAEWLNRPLFEYLPLFNKFRAPNSIMNVMALLITIPAIIGFQKWLDRSDSQIALRHLYISVGTTAGLAILAFLILGSGNLTSPGDSRYPQSVVDIFVQTRKEILKADVLRTLAFAGLGFALLWAYTKNYITNKNLLFSAIGVLMIIDLWSVGKRYLDDDNFVPESQYDQNFAPRPVDQQIRSLEPKGRGYYRVLDLSINTFNSSMTSKHHNTIGGYHAAKLQRYQDLIDYHISRSNPQVLNMLNAKYIITGEGQLQTNPDALGNAWFVNKVKEVSTPLEEIDALNQINTTTTAAILKSEFSQKLSGFIPGSGQGSIELNKYEPDNQIYLSNSNEENLAVFSEIWYGPDKGLTATIDGVEVPIIRVNYALRAIRVPAGEHTIEFSFEPQLPSLFRILTFVGALPIFLGFIGVVGWKGYQWLQEDVEEEKVKEKTKRMASKHRRKRK